MVVVMALLFCHGSAQLFFCVCVLHVVWMALIGLLALNVLHMRMS